jgi:crossover junction endodeoxyribonuclease RuvC
MIILGIDPGTLITGFGVIKIEHSRYSVLAYNVIKNANNNSMPIRLKRIYERLCDIIKQYHPDELAIETAFYGKNVQSALKIGHARGVSILAAVNHDIPTTEYSPREIKKAVTGNGTATKQQVQFMVKSQLKLRDTPKHLDVTDALAVALCHSFRISNRSKIIHKGKSESDQKIRSARRSILTTFRDWSEFVNAHPERVVRRK